MLLWTAMCGVVTAVDQGRPSRRTTPEPTPSCCPWLTKDFFVVTRTELRQLPSNVSSWDEVLARAPPEVQARLRRGKGSPKGLINRNLMNSGDLLLQYIERKLGLTPFHCTWR